MRKFGQLFVDDDTGFYCLDPVLLNRMAAMLRRLEWSSRDDIKRQTCPCCTWHYPTHEARCDLATLLRDLP